MEIETTAAAAAFAEFGAAAAALDVCAPPACGDDVFSAVAQPLAALWLGRTVAEKTAVGAAESAVSALGADNVASYEGRDAQNGDNLAPPVLI